MPRVKAVIAVGVGGATQGAWRVPAKALSYFGSTESPAYKIVYGLAFFIEQKFGAQAIYCPPDMDPEFGARYPLQSLKLHAELAGLGARSLAGDILLHPQFGYMYYASCFTEFALPPDKPLAENPCPAPSCVNMFRQEGRTPCMKFCRPNASPEKSMRRANKRRCTTTWPPVRNSPSNTRPFRSCCVTQSRPTILRNVRRCYWASATRCFGTE